MPCTQCSSEVGWASCASTLIVVKWCTSDWTTGRYSWPGSEVEKPALRSGVHCIGVRTESRSGSQMLSPIPICLLYTSDAADDLLCVDLGGRRIIKKKK